MEKLFVYGTLCPGRPNEHILKRIDGNWQKGFVIGKLYEEGWGAAMGYPGIRLDSKVEKVHGYVFSSKQLVQHWKELDYFEGEGYQRVRTEVVLEDEQTAIEAFVYELKEASIPKKH